jgi:hypothetical protein
MWLKIGTVEDSFERGNETSGSIKVGKFLNSCVTGGFSRRAQLYEVSLLSLFFEQNNHCQFSYVNKLKYVSQRERERESERDMAT